VRREGKRVRAAHLELRVATSPLSYARVGFIVPKHGETSVARNRLKRRLRELVRIRVLPTLLPQDVVIRTLPSAYAQSWETLRRDVTTLAGRLTHAPGELA
jgi:ribonuclease P protein component